MCSTLDVFLHLIRLLWESGVGDIPKKERLFKSRLLRKNMERRKGGWRSSIGRGGYGPELWKAIKKEWDPFISKTSFELVMGGR